MLKKMRKYCIMLACLVLALGSCKKTEEPPGNSGEIVLSSELLQSGQDYVFYGFSFVTGKISLYSLSSSVLPDLAAIHVIMGDNITVDLTSSNDVDAFYLNGIFATAAEAEAFFDSYTEVTAQEFQPLAQDIQVNQVWTVQPASKCFAKIWIREITYQEGSLSDFADVRIRYRYQPDGSRTFE
jgi:hypothetical protein